MSENKIEREVSLGQALQIRKTLKERLVKMSTDRPGENPGYILVSQGVGEKRHVQNFALPLVEIEKSLLANMQQRDDNLRNYRDVCCAIVKANAETHLDFDGEKITIAEAIELRRTIEFDRFTLTQLQRQYAAAQERYNVMLNDMNNKIEANVAAMKSDSMTAETLGSIRESVRLDFESRMKPELVDPINIKNRIERLTRRIEEYDGEITYRLNEVNATTKVKLHF